LFAIAVIGYQVLHSKGNQSIAINNSRQIQLALKLFAYDHEGVYPDAAMTGVTNSNIVFDELIEAGIVTSEQIFGAPWSRYPDRNLATPLASLDDQVHWAYVLDRNAKSNGASATPSKTRSGCREPGHPPGVPQATRSEAEAGSGVAVASSSAPTTDRSRAAYSRARPTSYPPASAPILLIQGTQKRESPKFFPGSPGGKIQALEY